MFSDAILRDNVLEDWLQFGDKELFDNLSDAASQNTAGTDKKRKPLKLIRVMDERRLEAERQKRVETAFTFGLKLHKGLPDRYELFQSLTKINKSRKNLGLSKK